MTAVRIARLTIVYPKQLTATFAQPAANLLPARIPMTRH